eukprot:366490-Chlamydomonas_euryale.AAC.10
MRRLAGQRGSSGAPIKFVAKSMCSARLLSGMEQRHHELLRLLWSAGLPRVTIQRVIVGCRWGYSLGKRAPAPFQGKQRAQCKKKPTL